MDNEEVCPKCDSTAWHSGMGYCIDCDYDEQDMYGNMQEEWDDESDYND